MASRSLSKDSWAKAFSLELQRHLTRTIEAASSKDECKRVETREEYLARIRSTPFSNDLGPPVDEILLPKNLVGNGRKLEKNKNKKKSCLGVGISNAKKKNKVAMSTKCKKQRAIKV